MKDSTINLLADYQIDVSVPYGKGKYCYGQLTLSQEHIQIQVMREQSKSSRFPFDMNMDQLTCTSNNDYHILIDVRFLSSKTVSLGPINNFTFFEIFTYRIECVLKLKGFQEKFRGFSDIVINSQELIPWIGRTTTQNKLLDNPHDPENRITEWQTYTGDILNNTWRNFLIGYNSRTGYSGNDLTNTTALFPTALIQLPLNDVTNVPMAIKNILCLFSLLLGKNMQKMNIEVGLNSNTTRWAEAYIKISKPSPEEISMDEAFIPLCENLNHPDGFTTNLGQKAILNFLDFENGISSTVRDYIRYRDMQISEERYLGMFRILEKLTYVRKAYFDQAELDRVVDRVSGIIHFDAPKKRIQSFIKRTKKLNAEYGDAESSIRIHLSQFSPEMKSYMGVDESKLRSLIDLRNNITHANPYNLSESEFLAHSTSCEILACSAILSKMQFPLKTICVSCERLNQQANRQSRYSALKLSKHFDNRGAPS